MTYSIGERMTIPVVVKPSGKVVGIKGLYKDISSGRFYVRVSFHGIDKQVTIFPKNSTFSGLKQSAEREVRTLKSKVKNSASIKEGSAAKQTVNSVMYGMTEIKNRIIEVWTLRGCTEKSIKKLIHTVEGFSICASRRQCDISAVENHNITMLKEIVDNRELSEVAKYNKIRIIANVFKVLIENGCHTGSNPTLKIPKPKCVASRRKSNLTLDYCIDIIKKLNQFNSKTDNKKKEMILFFILCVETGQRPVDLSDFDYRKIDNNHYQFESKKTNRKQRVEHLLSDFVLKLINEIIADRQGVVSYKHEEKHSILANEEYESFWSSKFKYMSSVINRLLREMNDGVVLYNTRHLFISEIFKQTNSEFWASAFTHDGETTNQKHYLHIDQKEADKVLSEYVNRFEALIFKEKIFN